MHKKTKINIAVSLMTVIVIIFCALIAIFPGESIAAAKGGLLLWFNNVLPSLLPFIIGINLLMGLGTLNGFGKLLSPIMKPLFKVSGIGGFALAAGMMSGYPMGAKIVSSLRKDNSISKIEAQRLIGFSNNSGPLFIIGAVGVGMFGSSIIGYFILTAHYLSAVISGIFHRFYKSNDASYEYTEHFKKKHQNSDSFLTLLSDSVKNAMETILMIGGFIILFSVISTLLQESGVIIYITELLSGAGQLVGLNKEGLSGVLTGLIEITNGTNLVAASSQNRPAFLAVTAIISFGGFSIHTQAAGFIKETDISFGQYILSKAAHAFLSVAVGIALLPFFGL
ncbi:MAG: sporulation integral membrane protein YlbJ [Defluviitaleaceae bacterium]|nr:sporulation integral membrane protein YlbJ [Defluviitaleaceae bacterium]